MKILANPTLIPENPVISIEGFQTVLLTTDKEANTICISLNIGTITIGALFHHEPPTPEEIETAINIIEDELMLAVPLLQHETVLTCKDAFVQTIFGLAGNNSSNTLSIKAMEELFSRFAYIAMGHSPQTDIIPLDANFAANFLILREIMHHLKFEQLNLLAD